jgi:hypothetical protein
VKLTGRYSISLSGAQHDGGDTFLVTGASTATANVLAGTYGWEVRMTSGSETYVAERGTLVVTANAVSDAVDARSHAETMLALIEAELEARVTGVGSAHVAYAQAGDGFSTSIQKLTLAELQQQRAVYAAQVQAERRRGKPYMERLGFVRA